MTASSGAIPIDLNVAGVQQLSLVVTAANGNTTGNHAVWADARLVTTANFSQSQVSPYTLTWQVSQSGKVLLTQTTDSFLFPYSQPGAYTVSLTASDGQGELATTSTTVTVASPCLGHPDRLGHQDAGQLDRGLRRPGLRHRLRPVQAACQRHGHSQRQATYTWTTTSSDPRAFQVPGSSNRVAAVWYSSTKFTVDVNLADGQAHDLELYFRRLGQQGPERAGPDQRRRHGYGAGHRDDLVVR